jgi:hypothetical protein
LRRCAVVHNLHVLARSQVFSTEIQSVACFLDRRSRSSKTSFAMLDLLFPGFS